MSGPRYETAVPIGRGAIAEVMRARDPRLGRDVALKILRHDDPALAERMLGEARAQASIDHPNVCRVYDTGRLEDGRPFIAMQLIEGETLDVALADKPPEHIARILRDVADAVHAAHRAGMVHRDLKPANIMVAHPDDGPAKPYVLDFGLARLRDAPGATETGQVLGTPAYMAPEQARGERSVDRRADVWALGAMLYEALTGRRPFEADSTVEMLMAILGSDPTPPRQIAPEVHADLETIALTCLEKEPDRRYPTARALKEDLDRWLAGEPIAARPASTLQILARRARRHKTALVAAGAIVLLSLAGGVKYTLDLRAAGERERAARADAEGLLDFMLEDLYTRLEPLGKVELLSDVSRQAVDHYRRRGSRGLGPTAEHGRARARRNLGKVLQATGDLEGATENQRAFRDAMARLVAQQPQRDAWRTDLAEAEVLLGEALQEQGELEEALEHYRLGLAAAEEVAGRDGEAAAPMLWEAGANVGWASLELARFDAAEAALQEALTVAQEAAAREPSELEWRYRLAVTHSYLGFVDLDQPGGGAAAVAHFTDSLAAVQAMREEEPDNARWRFEAGLVLGRLGFAWETVGELETALERYREGRVVMAELIAQDPDNTRWLRELAVHLSGLAAVHRELGRSEEALEPIERSLEVSRRLASLDAGNTSAQNDLAADLTLASTVLRELGREERARALLEEAVAVIEPVLERVDTPYYQATRITALLHLGRIEEARPLVAKVLASGWGDESFLALCRRHGLLPASGEG